MLTLQDDSGEDTEDQHVAGPVQQLQKEVGEGSSPMKRRAAPKGIIADAFVKSDDEECANFMTQVLGSSFDLFYPDGPLGSILDEGCLKMLMFDDPRVPQASPQDRLAWAQGMPWPTAKLSDTKKGWQEEMVKRWKAAAERMQSEKRAGKAR